QVSHDRAKPEFVPVVPPRSTQKLTNAEHHGTELGCGPRLVVAKYWLIRGSPCPSATPSSSCAIGIHGSSCVPGAGLCSGGGSPGNSANRVRFPSSWVCWVKVPLSTAIAFAIIASSLGGTSVKT